MRFWICVVLSAGVGASAAAEIIPPVMPVYGVRAAADGVTVDVPPQGSGQCTPRREMLTVAVSKASDGVTLLVTPRHAGQVVECRASGSGADVHWDYGELGLAPGQVFRLGNPLVAAPKP